MNMKSSDAQIITQITLDMAKAQNASEIMKSWDQDVIWFDITARYLRGYDAVYEEFDRQFSKLRCCGADILEMLVDIEGNMGIVNTVQHFWAIAKDNDEKEWIYTRQTDIYRKKNGVWKLVEQHISMCLNDM